MVPTNPVQRLMQERSSRWRRLLRPPEPLYCNPEERKLEPPLGRWNLYIGGAGSRIEGYVNVDLFPLLGVDVVCNAEQLPFRDNVFQRAECDAVLEHTACPDRVVAEIRRCLQPGGFVHLVVPFCHPFHEYPRDYFRFTPDGLVQLAKPLEAISSGWRTGPTATLLVFVLEYVKLWLPGRWPKKVAHFVLGWLLFPLRYLDRFLFRKENAKRLGNHCFLWAKKN